jgi:hypothetical protein
LGCKKAATAFMHNIQLALAAAASASAGFYRRGWVVCCVGLEGIECGAVINAVFLLSVRVVIKVFRASTRLMNICGITTIP